MSDWYQKKLGKSCIFLQNDCDIKKNHVPKQWRLNMHVNCFLPQTSFIYYSIYLAILMSNYSMIPTAMSCFIRNNKLFLYISISSQAGNACLAVKALIWYNHPPSSLPLLRLSGSCVFRKQENDSPRCLVFTARKVGLCSSFSSVLYSWGAVRRAAAVCKWLWIWMEMEVDTKLN